MQGVKGRQISVALADGKTARALKASLSYLRSKQGGAICLGRCGFNLTVKTFKRTGFGILCCTGESWVMTLDASPKQQSRVTPSKVYFMVLSESYNYLRVNSIFGSSYLLMCLHNQFQICAVRSIFKVFRSNNLLILNFQEKERKFRR